MINANRAFDFVRNELDRVNEKATLLDYALVWVVSSDAPVTEPSKYSFKTNSVGRDSFSFPWCL